MQWLDRFSAVMINRTPPHRRVFRDGWGDPDVLDWYSSVVGTAPEVTAADPVYGPERWVDGLAVRDLSFESPAPHLPEGSRVTRARLVSPPQDPERVLLLMAAWNEHGYGARTKLARLLAANGIGTMILENPYYGSRRPDPEDDRPLATVSDFAVMGRAAVIDGIALLSHLHGSGHTTGVGGYSMGGQMAGYVGMLAGFPTAITPVSSAHTPAAPFLNGVMRGSIAWEALGGEDFDTEQRLGDFLRSASILNHPAPPHTAAAVIVAGTIDGFIPASSALAIHRHWPGSKMEWVHAGHATMLWRNKDRMARAAVETFERLEADKHSEV